MLSGASLEAALNFKIENALLKTRLQTQPPGFRVIVNR